MGLSPIRSHLSIRSSVPQRGSSLVRSPGPIRGPRNMGLASSGSNRPGTLPPYLGRAGPLRSFSGTARLRATSLLPISWRILHQCHFTNYLVEGSGWRSGRILIEYPPGIPLGGTTFFIIREYFTRMGMVCLAEAGSPDSIIWS